MSTDKDLEREVARLREQVAFYKRREEYFAEVFSVADAGQYRADWDGAVDRWRSEIAAEEREACIAALEAKRPTPWPPSDYAEFYRDAGLGDAIETIRERGEK